MIRPSVLSLSLVLVTGTAAAQSGAQNQPQQPQQPRSQPSQPQSQTQQPASQPQTQQPASQPQPQTQQPASQPQPQPQAQEDVITLHDGSLLRGHVAEVRAGQSVTIVLITGEVRRIAWLQIASGSGPSFPHGNSSSNASSTAPAPLRTNPPPRHVSTDSESLLEPSPDRVPVEIESPERRQTVAISLGEIAMTGPRGSAYGIMTHDVCDTPCTLYVNTGPLALFTHGNGVRAAYSRFDVPATGLRVRMRSPSAVFSYVGYAGLVLGAGGIVAGVSTLVLADTLGGNASLVGGVLLGAGLVLAAGGIVLFVVGRGGPESVTPMGLGNREARLRFGGGIAPTAGGGVAFATLAF